MNKLISIEEFQKSIRNYNNFTVTGFRWSGTPQLLLRSIRDSFDHYGKPNNVTIIFTSSATDPGIDHLAHPDLLSCSYGSYYGSIPKIRQLVEKNLISGYSLPQGQLSLLFREIARGSPGLISKIGMNTYVDPLLNGGKLNNRTKDDAIERIKIKNEDYLFYKKIDIDIALIRGTVSDKLGNISMKNEPVKTEFLSMAQAARSCGGKVYVQVSSESNNLLSPNEIDLPSHLVDGYIIADNIERDHRQTNKYTHHEGLLNYGDYNDKITVNNDPLFKKIIAKKALEHVNPISNIILGQGVPELVGVLARKNTEIYKNLLTFMESGVIGGIPERRPDFGVAFNPSAFLTQDHQFVGFNGGHIDTAILSFVEFDQFGNINVSKLGKDYFGCGGYIDICHSAKKIIFVGSFTAKGLAVKKSKDKISIVNEGKIHKAVKNVKEITFSPIYHNKRKDEIKIITERCIFNVENGKVILKDVFPGIDIQNDILNQMEFKPQIEV
tara:strand:- start:1945 stop:3432 length:1488 start_codon:yes stop_codon:yes gene_type:complete